MTNIGTQETEYISHQYQDLLYCNSSQYILSTFDTQHNNNNVVLAMTMPGLEKFAGDLNHVYFLKTNVLLPHAYVI